MNSLVVHDDINSKQVLRNPTSILLAIISKKANYYVYYVCTACSLDERAESRAEYPTATNKL